MVKGIKTIGDTIQHARYLRIFFGKFFFSRYFLIDINGHYNGRSPAFQVCAVAIDLYVKNVKIFSSVLPAPEIIVAVRHTDIGGFEGRYLIRRPDVQSAQG